MARQIKREPRPRLPRFARGTGVLRHAGGGVVLTQGPQERGGEVPDSLRAVDVGEDDLAAGIVVLRVVGWSRN